MKLIKKVAIIGLATFALGSTVAFGEGPSDNPLCAKQPTTPMAQGKDVKDAAPAPAAGAKAAGITLPPPAKPTSP